MQPMFFHSPPELPQVPATFPPSLEETQQHKRHLLDQETGQASVHIEIPPTETGESPLEDNSSGLLFKETAAELPVSECLQSSQAPMVVQLETGANPTCGLIVPGNRRLDESAVAGQGLFDSVCAPPGFVWSCEEARPAKTAARKAAEKSSLLYSSSIVLPPGPPPRPLLPPATSASPPPIPPSPPPPHLETISPTHMVMPIKGGVVGTVQFAGMTTNAAPPSRQSAATTWKRRLFGIGKDEPDKGVPAAISVRTEDRQNLLDEISTMGHAVLKCTSRLRSPGGTPVKITHTNSQAPTSNNSDMLQRALLTKFRSLHSTPLSQSRSVHQDYSASLDFSNAWSDVNASQVFEDPDISASSLSGLAFSKNDSSNAHNGSSAV